MQDYSNIIHDTVGQEAIEAYDFIDKHTDYDVNLIWDNILRLENQADIKKNMQLNYILDSKHGTDISEVLKKKRVALVLHFYFEDLAEYCLHYVQSMPKEADIYVTVGSEKKKKIISDIVKNDILEDDYFEFSKKDFEKHLISLSLSTCFFEKKIYYTYDEYKEHFGTLYFVLPHLHFFLCFQYFYLLYFQHFYLLHFYFENSLYFQSFHFCFDYSHFEKKPLP